MIALMQNRLSPVLVVLALLAGLLLVGPTASAKAKRVKVTASASASTAKVGATVKVKGKVTGRSARAKVVLLKKARKGWVVVTSAKVNAKRRYALRTKVAKGTTTYRVKVRKNDRVKAATSRTLRVRGTVKSTTSRSASVSAADQAAVDQILAETNAFRAANGKPALKLSAEMTTVARNWSQTMADTGVFKHNPNYSTQIPAGWRGAGENIAAGYALSAVVKGWIDSPGHRANMLGDFTHIGIGYVSKPGTQYTRYYTQVFAKY